jgi:hypothetical protein
MTHRTRWWASALPAANFMALGAISAAGFLPRLIRVYGGGSRYFSPVDRRKTPIPRLFVTDTGDQNFITRQEHEECVKLVINHWRNRYLALEHQLEIAMANQRRRSRKVFPLAARARLLKKQAECFRKADQYQRYLAGYISSRRMCELVGFADVKNTLAPILQQLQMAHDALLDRGFHDQLQLILGALQAGVLDRAAAHQLLGMAPEIVHALLFSTPQRGKASCT